MKDNRIEPAYWALRVAFGVVPIVAGLDKLTNLLVSWEVYLSSFAEGLLPVGPATFMRAVGIIEIIVGIGVLSGHARVFAWIAAGWLIAISLNLLMAGYYDIAARDVALATSSYALARLAPAHEAALAPRAAPEEAMRAHA
jgi:uncharacterized membrane protein YphA (DoxX/SURF4 family)